MLNLLFNFVPGIVIFPIIAVSFPFVRWLAHKKQWPQGIMQLVAIMYLWLSWEVLAFMVALAIEDWDFAVPVLTRLDTTTYATVEQPAPPHLQPIISFFEYITHSIGERTAGLYVAFASVLVTAVRWVRCRFNAAELLACAGLNIVALLLVIMVYASWPIFGLNRLPETPMEIQNQYLLEIVRIISVCFIFLGLIIAQAVWPPSAETIARPHSKETVISRQV